MTKQFDILLFMEVLLSRHGIPSILKKTKQKSLYFLYGGNIDFKYKVSTREKWERKVLPGTLPMLRKYILISSLMQYAVLNI